MAFKKLLVPVVLLILIFLYLSFRILFYSGFDIENFHIIAHSGGGLDGYIYMNALEAYEYEYVNGTRMFDADVRFTTDDVLVLRHEWTDNFGFENSSTGMNYEEFINTKMFSKYTPMSFENLLDFMNIHKDVYVFLDVKENLEKAYRYIVNMAQEKCTNCLERMVVSFYNYADYFLIKEIYDFKYYSIRKYPNYNLDINEILQFCIENNIQYLNIMEQYFNKNILKMFQDNGIKVNLAIIDGKKVCEYIKMGVDGVISNFVTEKELKKCLKE